VEKTSRKNIKDMKYFEMKNTVKKTDSVDVLKSRMESTEEVSVKLEIEQDKLPIMNNREGKYAKSYKGRIKSLRLKKHSKE